MAPDTQVALNNIHVAHFNYVDECHRQDCRTYCENDEFSLGRLISY